METQAVKQNSKSNCLATTSLIYLLWKLWERAKPTLRSQLLKEELLISHKTLQMVPSFRMGRVCFAVFSVQGGENKWHICP